jgi:putative ABC transport system permease protein
MADATCTIRFRFWLWLIRVIGVIVPRRLRADWRQEWEAELRCRELLLAEWDKLDWRSKLDLLRRSVGAFRDALLLQPRRLEDEMFQDLRYGLRMLLKHPGFSLIAIFTLALGIGANTAIFSVVQAVLLRPLPYAEAERLLQIRYSYPRIADEDAWVAQRDMIDWQAQSQSFERIGVYRYAILNLSEGGPPEAVYGLRATANLLPMLGERPALGRLFSPEEDRPGSNHVIILSDDLWRRRFGARPEIIGSTIRANAESYVVIGVMPPGFNFPLRLTLNDSMRLPSRQMGFWIPIGADQDKLSREDTSCNAVARLKPGVSIERAQAEVNAVMAQLARDYPQSNAGREARLVSLKDQTVGESPRAVLLLLLGGVGLVVLLACANMAGLLLVRADSRRREMAIRQALGATRLRLARQMLTESMLLALGGGAAGLLLAHWSLPLVLKLGPPTLPRIGAARIDLWVFGFSLAVTSLAGLLFGLAPAWRAARNRENERLNEGLKQTGRGARLRRSFTGGALIVSETAIALVLTIGAGLLLNSFARVLKVDPGFSTEHVLASTIVLPSAQYPTPQSKVDFFRRVLERIEALPGVEAAGATDGLPLSGHDHSDQVRIEGRPPVKTFDPGLQADTSAVSPHYLRAIGATLLRGRFIDEQDRVGSLPVTIISETAAERFWPGEDPLGKRLSVGLSDEKRVWRQVVGIVRSTRHRGLDGPVRPEVFLPIEQTSDWPFNLAVRSTLPKESLAGAVRRAVAAVDPAQPIFLTTSMEEMLADSLSERRFSLSLLTAFSLLALLLAAVGIYGVLSYTVTRRTHEIGVRLALGAGPRQVSSLMVKQGMKPALIGMGTGLAAALGLTRLMKSLLFGVSATDPLTFAAGALLLTGVALLACYFPARRATKVDPLIALRRD